MAEYFRCVGEIPTMVSGFLRGTALGVSSMLPGMNLLGPAPGQRALRKGRISLAHHYYLVTTVCECRIAHFADATRAAAAASVLREERIWRDSTPQCWVLMPDHLHILLRLGCTESLSHLMNRMKSVTALAAMGGDRSRGRIWMRGFHDRAIRSEEDLQAVARYVIENPIRAGLADMLGAYPFWGCAWERSACMR